MLARSSTVPLVEFSTVFELDLDQVLDPDEKDVAQEARLPSLRSGNSGFKSRPTRQVDDPTKDCRVAVGLLVFCVLGLRARARVGGHHKR